MLETRFHHISKETLKHNELKYLLYFFFSHFNSYRKGLCLGSDSILAHCKMFIGKAIEEYYIQFYRPKPWLSSARLE